MLFLGKELGEGVGFVEIRSIALTIKISIGCSGL
jgi:hypothetical protein